MHKKVTNGHILGHILIFILYDVSLILLLFSGSASDIEELNIVPDSQEPQPDSPAEDVVSVMLKRENSLRHSQRHAMRNGRFVINSTFS